MTAKISGRRGLLPEGKRAGHAPKPGSGDGTCQKIGELGLEALLLGLIVPASRIQDHPRIYIQ